MGEYTRVRSTWPKAFHYRVAGISGVDNIRGNACGVLQGDEILSYTDSLQVIPNDHRF